MIRLKIMKEGESLEEKEGQIKKVCHVIASFLYRFYFVLQKLSSLKKTAEDIRIPKAPRLKSLPSHTSSLGRSSKTDSIPEL